jgi:DNA-binding XRE family transcriptional regulator
MLKYATMDTPNPSINVKELRERKNLSRRKVSVALDVAESTVVRWETGVVKPHLPLQKVKTMMELFQCDFITLYEAFEQTALESQQQTDRIAVNSEEKQPISV